MNKRYRSFENLFWTLILFSLCSFLSVSCSENKTINNKQEPASTENLKQEKVPVVAIANYGGHPLVDITIDAFKMRMKELGYEDGKNIQLKWSSIDGNLNLISAVIDGLMKKSPDVIVPITTPISQTTVKKLRGKIPIVFCGVTDPVGSKIVKSLKNEIGSGVTGTSDLWPFAEQLDLLKEIMPKAKRIGIPYNKGEENSQYALDIIIPLAKKRNLEIITANAPEALAVRKAVDSLVIRGIDAIFVTADNTVMTGFPAILKVAHERKIPVFVGDSASVESGGLATYSVDFTKLGISTANILDRVLKGEKPGSIPVATFTGEYLYLNPEAAVRMGISISKEILDRAKIVKTKKK